MSGRWIDRRELRRGFVAMLPLWLGAVPFALAFAILARSSGLSTVETEALSVFVFAGSAQPAFVRLVKEGAGGATILVTVLLLNLRHVLYGLSLNAHLPRRTRPPRPVLAAGMTDESYGLTIRAYSRGSGSDGFFFGANPSLLLAFAATTLVSALIGSRVPHPERLGLDLVFPLWFLGLLLPLLRTRLELAVALVAGSLAIFLSRSFGGGAVVLVSSFAGVGLGTLLDCRRNRARSAITMGGKYVPLIVMAGLITHTTRFAGLAFGDRAAPPVVRRALAYVPIAAFAALAAPGLGGTTDDPLPRFAAAASAAFVVLRYRRLWACIGIGMVVFWLTRWSL